MNKTIDFQTTSSDDDVIISEQIVVGIYIEVLNSKYMTFLVCQF